MTTTLVYISYFVSIV